MGKRRIYGIISSYPFYHFPACEKGRHILKQFFFSIEDTDSHGRHELMSGKCEKIHIQLLNVYGNMRRALCGICHHYGAVLMSDADDFLYRVLSSEHIGNLCDSRQPGAGCKGFSDLLLRQLPVLPALQEFQLRSRPARHHLPGQEIAVMLHDAHQDFISGAQAV